MTSAPRASHDLWDALDALGDGLARVEDGDRIVVANAALAALLAATPDALVGRRLAEFVTPDDAARLHDGLERARAKGRGAADVTLVRAATVRLPVHVHVRGDYVVVRHRPADERAERLARALVDLACHEAVARGQRADALRRIAEVAAASLDVERVSFWELADEGAAIHAVEEHERTPGTHVAGTVLTRESSPRYFAAIADARTLAADDAQHDPRTAGFNAAYLVPRGITSMLDVPIRREGRMIGVVCNEHIGPPRRWQPEERYFAAAVADLVALTLETHDRRVAERMLRQTEERLHAAHKLEALGRLAGGIAHDFNNVLTAIAGFAHVLEAAGPDAAEGREAVRGIADAARRGSDLTAQLLAFARRRPKEPGIVDPDATLTAMEPMLTRLLGDGVSLVLLPGAGRNVVGDRSQLEQVVMNLAVNARDAMPAGGLLTVRTEDVDLVPAEATRRGAARPGPHVRLTVADSGVGMDAAVRAHIFEPFFTTKPGGRGTGLGLAIVEGVVRQWGGGIDVETAPGRGTQFVLDLPAAPTDGTAPVVPPASPFGRGVVLLVEDEPTVRRLAHRALTAAGFVVLAARDAEEGLRLATQWAHPLVALVTDVVLPGRGGYELATTLAASRPGLAVVLTSAFVPASHTDAALPPHRIVVKPFTSLALVAAVEEALAARA